MKKLSLFFLFSAMLFACGETGLSDEKLDLDRYIQLEKTLTTDFSNLATRLRNVPSNLNDKDAVIDVVKDTYGKDSELYNVFLNFYEKQINISSSGRSAEVVINLTPVQEERITQILNHIPITFNLEEFLIYLDDQFSLIANQPRMLASDKDFLLSYIVSYKATLVFINTNIDLINTGFEDPSFGGRTQGWWDSWGKCAAGIIGGAGSVGVGYALAGAGAGTVILPVVGTVSVAVVAGVAGAVFGGLAGAAAAC
jgi:hypothetical protein